MRFVVVIPARYGSTRLAGKPLAELAGRPMVAHVWERACRAGADEVVVATDDARVAEAMDGLGAEVAMTDAAHASGTDRVEEVACQRGWADERIVVNVQGDEPLIPPELIHQVAELLSEDSRAGMATLSEPIGDPADLFRSSVVKVVNDIEGRAIYFSRAPIPWARDAFGSGPEGGRPTRLPNAAVWRRHLGVYAYRAGLLREFVAWPPAPLEVVEGLEQLRALYHGVAIRIADACRASPPGVDTLEDLERVRAALDGR